MTQAAPAVADITSASAVPARRFSPQGCILEILAVWNVVLFALVGYVAASAYGYRRTDDVLMFAGIGGAAGLLPSIPIVVVVWLRIASRLVCSVCRHDVPDRHARACGTCGRQFLESAAS
jgi:hypothetical protein